MEELKREIMSQSKIMLHLYVRSSTLGDLARHNLTLNVLKGQYSSKPIILLRKRTSLTERAILEAREQRNEGFAQFVTRTKWKVLIFLRKKQGRSKDSPR